MSSNKLALLVTAAALITTVGQAIIYHPHLPDNMASHFGANGVANGSMSKNSFLILMVGLQFGMAAFLIGLSYFMKRLPTSMLNIPHKEYWLHEDRVDETIAFNKKMLYWTAAITAVFLVLVFQLTIQANLGQFDRSLSMPLFVGFTVVFLIAIFAICGRMMMRFSKTPKH